MKLVIIIMYAWEWVTTLVYRYHSAKQLCILYYDCSVYLYNNICRNLFIFRTIILFVKLKIMNFIISICHKPQVIDNNTTASYIHCLLWKQSAHVHCRTTPTNLHL